jgi:hypothetical protein
VRKNYTDDSDIVTGSLELPESNIDGDTTLTLGLQLVKHPGVLEGTLAKFGGFLYDLLALCKTETAMHKIVRCSRRDRRLGLVMESGGKHGSFLVA